MGPDDNRRDEVRTSWAAMGTDSKKHSGRGFRASLQVKTMAAATIVLVAMSTMIALTVLKITRESVQESYIQTIRTTVDALHAECIKSFEGTPNVDELARLAKNALTREGIVVCAFFNERTEPLTYLSIQSGLRINDIADYVSTSDPDRIQRTSDVELELRPIFVKLGNAAEMISMLKGSLVVGYTVDPMRQQYGALQKKINTCITIVAAVTALIAWLGARTLVRPLRSLIQGTARVSRGEYDVEIKADTGDELQLLAESFNRMAIDIKESHNRLDEQNRNLERVVRSRTRKLQDANEELRSLDKMKDGFLSSISHEFKTPLTSIQAFGEILRDDRHLDEVTRSEFLAIILRESERMTCLVNDVLDLVKIESGEMQFHFTGLRPERLIEQVLENLEPRLKEHQTVVDLEVAPGLPEAHWDHGMISRILQEVVGNAVRFSPSRTRVEISAKAVEEEIELRIRDHGPGIPARDLERVFQKFRQGGDVLTNKPKGTGLGLPICRLIVEHHGGTIRALLPEEGGGVLLEIRLPALPPAAIASAIAPQEPETVTAASMSSDASAPVS